MVDVVFLIQNLAQKSDSIGFDCIFQYKELERLGKKAVIFADVFDKEIHKGVDIREYKKFYDFHKENKDVTIIYHFCDGWDGLDDYLIDNSHNAFVRWHNNTPPWFYAMEWPDFARGALRGFKTVIRMLKSDLGFLVNSEFTKRQLQALGGWNNDIFSVFPASPLFEKKRLPYNFKESKDEISLLFVSRMVPHKGHKHILSVSDIIQQYTKKKVTVNFVGLIEGRMKRYHRFLQAEAKKIDVDVNFCGLLSQEQLYSMYSTSDIFMCMSEHEGFGMPVFEAMRCGIPVVAWASTAFSDLLKSHPFSSEVFDPYWFAAAAVVSIEGKNFFKTVSHEQDKKLDMYNAKNVSNQFMNAILKRKEYIIHYDEERNINIENAIISIKNKMIKTCKKIRTYEFDSYVNYFSLYDVSVYDRILSSSSLNIENRYEGSVRYFEQYSILPHELDNLSQEDLKNRIGDIHNLILLDDDCFVKASFLYISGSLPNNNIIKYYVHKLRDGENKEDILIDIEKFSNVGDAQTIKKNNYYNNMDGIIERLNNNVLRIRSLLLHKNLSGNEDVVSFDGLDLEELLLFSDPYFIKYSFLLILGRRAEDSAVTYFVGKLATDLDRITFLKDLIKSDEVTSDFPPKVHGLERLYDSSLKIGYFNRIKAKSSILKKMSRLENDIGRIIMKYSHNYSSCTISPLRNDNDSDHKKISYKKIVSEKPTFINSYSMHALKKDDFVAALFETALGRKVDDGALVYFKGKIEEGVPREDIIREVLNTDEARLHRSPQKENLIDIISSPKWVRQYKKILSKVKKN